MEEKLDGNYTRTLRAVLNKSWKQHSSKQQLCGHLLPITKTIQIRRTKYAEHCWRSKDELITDILLWTLSLGRAKVGRPARTYIQQLSADTGCSLGDLPDAMDDRNRRRERFREIRADSVTWWWQSLIIVPTSCGLTILIQIYVCVGSVFTNTFTRTRCDTRSNFKMFDFRVFLLLDLLPNQG